MMDEQKRKELGIRTLGEVVEDVADAVVELLATGKKSGPWTFVPDGHAPIILHENGYYIDVHELSSCAGILDWIAQLAQKNWCSAADIGMLVRLMDDVLDFQANFCPGGRDQGERDVEKLLEKRLQLARDYLAETGRSKH